MDKVKTYVAQWNVMRILRLIMGIIIVVQGIKADMWLIIILGVLLCALPLFNIGCGPNGSCSVSRRD